MPIERLPNDIIVPRKRRPPNRTSRQNPRQEVFNREYRGLLKRNNKPPGTNPNPPHFVGVCCLNGEEYWISAWPGRYSSGGQKYLSLVFQLKERPGEPGESPVQYNPSDETPPPF